MDLKQNNFTIEAKPPFQQQLIVNFEETTKGKFHQHSMSSVYTRKSAKKRQLIGILFEVFVLKT
jgi:hypothetical protein